MKSAEASGRTVEEAIREALRILGARREDVDLIVLDEGSRGVFGIGARDARVRLTLLSEGGEEIGEEARSALAESEKADVETARLIVSELVGIMGFEASVTAREESNAVFIRISGANLGPLIGRHGQTLGALELVVNLIVARRLDRRIPVVLDAERYRERRRQTLQALARRVAARVRKIGRPVALDPMPAYERRIIHTALAGDSWVTTHSEGEGADRHVVVSPRVRGSSSGRDDLSGRGRGIVSGDRA